MIVTAPKELRTRIVLPASKSISNRALIMQALSAGQSQVTNVSECDDSQVVVAALRDKPQVIDIKAAGTAMRFLTSLLATTSGEHIITGTQRMKQRPIAVLVNALRSLGAEISYVENEGLPPLRIEGRILPGGVLSLPGDVSSQYISSLLMIGPTLQQGLTLHLTGKIVSRPYIEMTLSMMRDFGAKASWMSEDVVRVEAVPYTGADYHVESDWSAASYWYEMMALSGDMQAWVELPGLFSKSLQGDSAVAEIFAALGVKTEFGDEMVRLSKEKRRVEKLECSLASQPDLAQTVVVTCCMLGLPFRISGLQTLRIKETDRIAALQTELRKLGMEVGCEGDDVMCWDGSCMRQSPDSTKEVFIDTYEDHRMAMAFAPVAMKRGSIGINNPEVVSKSYPLYWDNLRDAGFGIEE